MEEKIDLDVALKTMDQLGLDDGDLGYLYWHQVRELLKRAGGMQDEIIALKTELEECRAHLKQLEKKKRTQH